MTYRTLRTYFMGICNLITNRNVVTSPELAALLNNPEILVYFNRVLIKLSILKQMNTLNPEEEVEFGEEGDIPGIDTEIDKMISKFKPDPALKDIDKELCRTDMDYLLHVEVLMAFDFDICNEYIEEINEFSMFKILLEKENTARSDLFQGYVSRTSESMQNNVCLLYTSPSPRD